MPKRSKTFENVQKRSKRFENGQKRSKRPKTFENIRKRSKRRKIFPAAEVCGSVAAGNNFRRFERFRTFSNVLGVFDRFRTFSSVFERFRTFSSVSALPELGTISADS